MWHDLGGVWHHLRRNWHDLCRLWKRQEVGFPGALKMRTTETFAPLLRTHAQGGGARHVVIAKEMAHTIEGKRLLVVIVLPRAIFKTNKIVHEVMAQHFVDLFMQHEYQRSCAGYMSRYF